MKSTDNIVAAIEEAAAAQRWIRLFAAVKVAAAGGLGEMRRE